ncbi:ATP-binding protein [Silvanigrella aquatica]|uniref:histidine kinase n=1 Tax=Silvanigrella aquatica TaxID=1915309 RepID=A0A1L4CYQ5_9BACT|nr:ATP-binding protein [Silvanigrella aquatica]APJ03065.1 hypothetical protein AXG55_03725 [Silvanigrella aquatica]
MDKKKLSNLEPNIFKNVFNNLPEIYLVISKNFTVNAANFQFINALSIDYNKIIGTNLFSFLGKKFNLLENKSADILKLSLQNVLKEKIQKITSILEFKDHGKLYELQNNNKFFIFSINPVLDSHKNIECIILKIDDVSESVKLKIEVIEKNKNFLEKRYSINEKEKIQNSIKMETLGKLTSGISHDINNLLTIINLNCDIILNSSQNISPVVKKQCSQIKKTSKYAGRLMQQILNFGKAQPLNPKVINVNIIISEIEKMLFRLINENIELELNLKEDLYNIKIDQGQMEQIILNLIINSRDAISDTGKIKIETTNFCTETELTLGSHKLIQGNYIVLSVSDSGIGMSPETQARIFEPYFSTKEQGKGTGLGLATVYSIVENYKGTIEIKTELGKGTTFNIYLPASDIKENSLAKEEEHQNLIGGHEAILVIEDKEDLKEVMVSVLRSHGYFVAAASHGREAIELIKNEGQKFRLIIMDVILPKMPFKLFIQEARALIPNIKILYISGNSHDVLQQFGINNNEMICIEKPFVISTLLKKVRNIIDK